MSVKFDGESTSDMNLGLIKHLNSLANDGRGVSCVRCIIDLLEHERVFEAKTWMDTEHDKIRNYPQLEAELNRLWDEFPWRLLGDVAVDRLGMQAQYCADYVLKEPGFGLRFRGNPEDYREIEIHRDDVETFVRRMIPIVKPGVYYLRKCKRAVIVKYDRGYFGWFSHSYAAKGQCSRSICQHAPAKHAFLSYHGKMRKEALCDDCARQYL